MIGIDLLDVEIARRLETRWPRHEVRQKTKMAAGDVVLRAKGILIPGRLSLAPMKLRMSLHHPDVDLVDVTITLVPEDTEKIVLLGTETGVENNLTASPDLGAEGMV